MTGLRQSTSHRGLIEVLQQWTVSDKKLTQDKTIKSNYKCCVWTIKAALCRTGVDTIMVWCKLSFSQCCTNMIHSDIKKKRDFEILKAI